MARTPRSTGPSRPSRRPAAPGGGAPSRPAPGDPAVDRSLGTAPPARPPAVVALTALLGLEAAAVAVGAGLGIAALLEGGRVAVAGAVVVCALGVAAALAACARSFWHGSTRARGPAATWQLLQGATAVTLLQGGVAVAGAAAVLAVSAVVLVLAVTRPAPERRV